MLNVNLSDNQNKSVLSLALATVYRPPGPYTDFLKEFADFLSDLLVNVDKALIVGDFNIHVDNTIYALWLVYWPNKLFWCQAKCHRADTSFASYARFNNIAWNRSVPQSVPQSDDVTDHFLVSCMLHITDINNMAPGFCVIVQAELLFQPLKTDSPITCLIYLNCSVYQ